MKRRGGAINLMATSAAESGAASTALFNFSHYGSRIPPRCKLHACCEEIHLTQSSEYPGIPRSITDLAVEESDRMMFDSAQ